MDVALEKIWTGYQLVSSCRAERIWIWWWEGDSPCVTNVNAEDILKRIAKRERERGGRNVIQRRKEKEKKGN